MKKVLSFVLALVMVLALSVTAFAETESVGPSDTLDSNKEINIGVNYTTKADETIHRYKVKIDWTTPSFSYEKDGATYTWDADKMVYIKSETPVTGAGWGTDKTKALSLKVTNYSDMVVKCAASLDDIADDGITVTSNMTTENWKGTADAVVDSTKPTDYLDNGSARTGKECDLSATITVDGTPNDKATGTIAKVTVTVAAA